MRRTEEEKNLLAKLASGVLDGIVGDEREYRGYRSVFCGKYIKDGEPVSYRQEYIESFPCGKAEFCWLSYEPHNEIARRLYRSFGFEETGEMDVEEFIAIRQLGGPKDDSK